MTHTRESLRTVSARMVTFRDLAAKAGRNDDADALGIAADVCGHCADAFGRADSPLRRAEDPADAARARMKIQTMMRPLPGPITYAEECCPYSKDYGLCPTCDVYRGPFAVDGSGRRFICLTQWIQRP